jgi:hypothetical protein
MGVRHFCFVLFCKFVSGNLHPWQTKFSLKLSLISRLSHNICTTIYLISRLSLNYRHNVSSLFSGLFLIVCIGVPARILNNFYLKQSHPYGDTVFFLLCINSVSTPSYRVNSQLYILVYGDSYPCESCYFLLPLSLLYI